MIFMTGDTWEGEMVGKKGIYGEGVPYSPRSLTILA